VERGASLFASRTRISQASHALQQARASIEQIDTKLRDSKSIAPFDGVIVKKHVEEGDTVQPGQPLLSFEDTGSSQIVAEVPVKLANLLEEGELLSANIDAHDIIIPVKVDNIFPTVDPTQHTVTVKFNLPTSRNIPAGTYAVIFIPNPSKNKDTVMITVPTTAIAQRGGLPVVFVLDKETSKVGMRLVRPGQQLYNGKTVIEYGLSENDLVIDKPTSYLVSGTELSNTKLPKKN
jgi:RND family efflux transporter MFP subunit